jgi:seryl-tRNA synthetase
VITPNVAKERNIVGCGFQSRSDKERQIYNLEGEDLDLVATAEITLMGLHSDEAIDFKKLPLKYVGLSSCYRKEIGSYGKDVRGILRVHEFKKVEMVVLCDPNDSDKIHEELFEYRRGNISRIRYSISSRPKWQQEILEMQHLENMILKHGCHPRINTEKLHLLQIQQTFKQED